MRGQRLSLVLLLGALVAVVGFGGCGSGAETTSAGKGAAADTTASVEAEGAPPPSGRVAPSKTLARIAAASPGIGVISGAEFDQEMTQEASFRGLKTIPKPGHKGYPHMRDESMDHLITAVWLFSEAEEMGVEPTDQEVAAALRKSGEEGSLREHEFTRATMMERAKDNLVVEKLEDAIARQSPKELQKAQRDFDTRFQAKWHARTHCVRGFVIKMCGNSRL